MLRANSDSSKEEINSPFLLLPRYVAFALGMAFCAQTLAGPTKVAHFAGGRFGFTEAVFGTYKYEYTQMALALPSLASANFRSTVVANCARARAEILEWCLLRYFAHQVTCLRATAAQSAAALLISFAVKLAGRVLIWREPILFAQSRVWQQQ